MNQSNSFNAGLMIFTPIAVPAIFPTVAQRIQGIPIVAGHFMPACRWHGDARAEVIDNEVFVNGSRVATLPVGSVVKTIPVEQ
jgi:hypothetical protein